MTPDKLLHLKKALLILSICLLLVSLAGFVWLHVLLKQRVTAREDRLPVFNQIPQFTLVERSGRPFGLDDLKEKVWVADFFFSTCPGPCPRMNARMAELQQALSGERDVRLVSITVDPDTDSPAVLADYAKRFHASDGRWYFLTGAKSVIHYLAKDGFMVGGAEDAMLHTTRFMLVDRQGRLRGYYDSSEDEGLKKLLTDIQQLLSDKGAG
jgi:protein SCO1/2